MATVIITKDLRERVAAKISVMRQTETSATCSTDLHGKAKSI